MTMTLDLKSDKTACCKCGAEYFCYENAISCCDPGAPFWIHCD